MKYITAAATTTIDPTYGIRIEFNKASAGVVTVSDNDGLKATIATGNTAAKAYYGFNGPITIVNASAEDLTVSSLNHQG